MLPDPVCITQGIHCVKMIYIQAISVLYPIIKWIFFSATSLLILIVLRVLSDIGFTFGRRRISLNMRYDSNLTATNENLYI